MNYFYTFLILLLLNSYKILSQNSIDNVKINQYGTNNENIDINFDVTANTNYQLNVFININNVIFKVAENYYEINNDEESKRLNYYFKITDSVYQVLNEGIYNAKFIINLIPSTKVSYTKHLVTNSILPGWQNKQLDNKKFHKTFGLLGYISVASAVYLNHLTKTNYQEYLKSINIAERDNLYDETISLRNATIALAATASIIWIYTTVKTIKKVKKLNNNNIDSLSFYYAEIKNKEKVESINFATIDLRTKYTIEIQKGNDLFIRNNYIESKKHYENALKIKPNDIISTTKIDLINNELLGLSKIKITYDSLINNAKNNFNKKLYNEAIIIYNKALNLENNNRVFKNCINGVIFCPNIDLKEEITKVEKQIKFENDNYQFDLLITQGKDFQKNKMYDKALNSYLKAKDYFDNKLVNNLINDVTNIMVQDKIKIGITNFDNEKFDVALKIFKEVLVLDPFNTSAKDYIYKIENTTVFEDNKFTDDIFLGEINGIKFYISFFPKYNCSTNSNSVIKYKADGIPNIYTNSYIEFTFEYIDCDGNLEKPINRLYVKDFNGSETFTNSDQYFSASKIVKKPYNIKIKY